MQVAVAMEKRIRHRLLREFIVVFCAIGVKQCPVQAGLGAALKPLASCLSRHEARCASTKRGQSTVRGPGGSVLIACNSASAAPTWYISWARSWVPIVCQASASEHPDRWVITTYSHWPRSPAVTKCGVGIEWCARAGHGSRRLPTGLRLSCKGPRKPDGVNHRFDCSRTQ